MEGAALSRASAWSDKAITEEVMVLLGSDSNSAMRSSIEMSRSIYITRTEIVVVSDWHREHRSAVPAY